MQDKSFLQAMQDLQDRVSSNFQEAIHAMLLHRTTAVNATVDIQNERMRTVVTNELITGQIIALLAFMKDLQILDEGQYGEFATYLRQALTAQHLDVITGRNSQ